MNMTEVITDVVLTKACSIKADKDSEESKVINLKVKFDGVQLGDVFAKALSSTVITWQNGVGRKTFDTFKNNQIVEINFAAPVSRAQIDPESAMIAKLQAMKPEERAAYLKELIAKVKKEANQ